MSEVYKRIVECLDRNDYECLASLAGTDEFSFILGEMEKRGYNRETVVAAIAAGSLDAVDRFRRVTVEVAESVNRLADMVNGGAYLDAISYVTSNPRVIDALNALSGRQETLEEFVAGLAAAELSKGVDTWPKVRDACRGSAECRKGAVKGFRSYLLSTVDGLCKEGKIPEAVELISRASRLVSGNDEKEVVSQAVALALSHTSDKDVDANVLSTLLSLAESLGVFDRRAADDGLGQASERIERELVEQSIGWLMSEIRSAIGDGKNVNTDRLKQLVSDFADVLRDLPLTVEREDTKELVTVPGVNMYQYLLTVIDYEEKVKPLLGSITETINTISSHLRNGEIGVAESLIPRLETNVERLKQFTKQQALLRYVSSHASGRPEPMPAAEFTVSREHRYYETYAKFLRALAGVSKVCNANSCNVDAALREVENLRRFFNQGVGAEEAYTSWMLMLTARAQDAAALLGLSPIDRLARRLGVPVEAVEAVRDRLTREDREVLGVILYRAVVASMGSSDSNEVELANKVLGEAISRGFDGKLVSLSTGIHVIKSMSSILQRVDRLRQEIERLSRPPQRVHPEAVQYERERQERLRKVQEEFVRVARQSAADLRTLRSTYGDRIKDFTVVVGEGASARHVSLADLLELYARELDFAARITTETLSLHDYITRAFDEAQNTGDLEKRTEILRNAVARINESISRVSSLGSQFGKNVDQTVRDLEDLRKLISSLQDVTLNAKIIDESIGRMLDLLKDGLRHPDETPRAVNSWENAVNALRRIGEVRDRADKLVSDRGRAELLRSYASSVYDGYNKLLSDLKTSLVHEDIRLEDVLNEAEKRAGQSINYTRPYLQLPVIGWLERMIKIGLAQWEDWRKRMPIVARELTGALIGFASAVTSLLQPYDAYLSLLYIYRGAQEFADKLLRGDLRGAFTTVVAPIAEAVTRDPAKFTGQLLGFIFLGAIGKTITTKLAAKFKMPGLIKLEALVTNLLQLDPLGVFVDYVAAPLSKATLTKLLAVWGFTPAQAGRVVVKLIGMPLTKVSKFVDAVRARIPVLANQFKYMAKLLYAWGDDVQRLYRMLEDIKSKKGVNYLIALRNYVLETDARLTKTLVSAREALNLVGAPRDLAAKPFAVLRLALGVDLDDAVKAMNEFRSGLQKLSQVMNVRVDWHGLSKLEVGNLMALRNIFKEVAGEAGSVARKMSEVIGRLDEYIRANHAKVYEGIRKQMDSALITRSLNPFEANRQIASLIVRLYEEFGIKVGNDVASKWAELLDGAGLKKLANEIRAKIDELKPSENALREAIKRFEVEVVEGSLAKLATRISADPVLSSVFRFEVVTDAVRRSAEALDLGAVIGVINDFVKAVDGVITTARRIDTLSLAKAVVEGVRDGLQRLALSMREAGLESFKPIKSAVQDMDRVVKAMNDLIKRLDEARARLDVELESLKPLIELANELKLKDVAEEIVKRGLAVDEAQSLLLGRLTIKTFDDLARLVEKAVNVVNKFENTPHFYVLRSFLTNLVVEVKAKIRDLELPGEVVKALQEFRARCPPDLLGAVDEVLREPRYSKLLKLIDAMLDRFGVAKPLTAAGLDIDAVLRAVGVVEDLLKRVSHPKFQIPDVRATLDAVDKIKRGLQAIREEIDKAKVKVELKLVDPGLRQALDRAAVELKKVYKRMSKQIDDAVSTLGRFLELVDGGRFDEAWRMYDQVMKAANTLWRLGMMSNIRDALSEGFRRVSNALKRLIGREVPETPQAKAVAQAVDEVASFLQRFGEIRVEPGYGFLATTVDEVVGFTIRAPVDAIDELVELLSVKRKDMTVTVGDAKLRAVRHIEKTPLDVRVRYNIESPHGKAHIEVVVKTVEFDPNTRKARNVAVVNYWYDPPLQGSPIVRQLAAELAKGMDFIRRMDPDVDVLAKVVTSAGAETVTFGRLLSTAAELLGAAITASIRMSENVKGDPVLNYIVSQDALRELVHSIPSIDPVPAELYSRLVEMNLVPVGALGGAVFVLAPHGLPKDAKSVEFVRVRLPNMERVVVPSLRDGTILVPIPPPNIEKPKDIPREVENVKVELDWSQVVDINIERITTPNIDRIVAPSIKGKTITPEMTTTPKDGKKRTETTTGGGFGTPGAPIAGTIPKIPTTSVTGGGIALGIGGGAVLREKLQY